MGITDRCVEKKQMVEEEMPMDKITTEMAEHICDMICGNLDDVHDQNKADEICADCKMGQFIFDILNEYNKINDFEQTQSFKLLKEIARLKEKEVPKRPKEYEDKYYACPTCGNVVMMKWKKYNTILNSRENGLPNCLCCNQKLDWSEQNEPINKR